MYQQILKSENSVALGCTYIFYFNVLYKYAVKIGRNWKKFGSSNRLVVIVIGWALEPVRERLKILAS